MNKDEIIDELVQFFSIEELVCNHTYEKFGKLSWQFLDTELLHVLLIVRRDILKVPMIVNHDSAYQRGLRCNLCDLSRSKTLKGQLYLSAHCNGAGIDFDAKGLTAEQTRNRIATSRHLLPYPIRLEEDVSWVHMDVYASYFSPAITYFKG